MKRRSILGSVSAIPIGLAGCISPTFGSDERSFRTLEVANVMDLPESGHDASVEVTRQPDADTPGRLSVALTNTTGRQQTVELGATPPFTYYWGRPEDVAEITEQTQFLQLVPDSREYVEPRHPNEDGVEGLVPDEPRSGCWTTHDVLIRNPIGVQTEIDSGETISETYTVVGYTPSVDCLPLDSYTFEYESYLSEDEPWGFTLRLTDGS